MSADGANEIARRARGTPRIAGRLLRRVRDFAHVEGAKSIDRKVADRALAELEVDAAGLDAMDRRYLSTIAENYGGGPVGVDTLAAALSEPRDAIEDIIEPFLIQKGFIQRTPRGRLLTSPPSSISACPSRNAIRASSGCSAGRRVARCKRCKAAVTAARCASRSPPILTASPIAIARCAARKASCI